MRRLAAWTVSAALLALGGCDLLLTDPAAVTSVTVEVTLDPVRAGFRTVGASLTPWGARELWLRLEHGNASRDTLVVATLRDDMMRATFSLHPNEMEGPLEIQAEVRLAGGLALLRGAGSVEDLGIAPSITIELVPQPVLASLDPGGGTLSFSDFDGGLRTEQSVPAASSMDIRGRDATVVISSQHSAKLYMIDPYSGQSRLVLDPDDDQAPFLQITPQFSADGDWIYFMGQTSSGTWAYQWRIWRVRPDGSDFSALWRPKGDILTAARPSPSHDGTRVAYAADWQGIAADYLTILDIRSGLSTVTDLYGVGAMRWSPDDQWIAYVRDVLPGERHLRLVRPDGTGDKAVAPDLSIDGSIDWTADGRYVLAMTPGGDAVSIDVNADTFEILGNVGRVSAVAVAP